MNEFEWHRQMRDLRQSVAPRRDLWLAIEPALGQTAGNGRPAHNRAKKGPLWLFAASFAGLTLLAVGLGLHQRGSLDGATLASTEAGMPRAWKPDDPRLAGAAVELEAARLELRQAIGQAPDSPALQRLLQRTQKQQTWLRHLDRAS